VVTEAEAYQHGDADRTVRVAAKERIDGRERQPPSPVEE
jgi:hypothetical protein